MANITFFQIPADNIDRARHFYSSLLGWKIAPTATPMDPAILALTQIQDISTGDAKEGEMNNGMLYKRQTTEPIINFVAVNDLDTILATVEKLGGRIIRAKEEIKSVGPVAIIQDSEGNVFGICKPE